MRADGSNHQQVARREESATARTLKDLLASEYVKGRFADVMGDKAPAFIASILNATRLNPALGQCEPMSVVGSAMVAASLDLPIDASLGFAAIVPYKTKDRMLGQFQIMTKGFVQLALRSGQYKTINVGPVYEDELRSIDIISGDIDIQPVEDGYRDQDRQDKVIGYAAFFRLLNGFEKIEYWPMKKILAHGKRHSKSFDREYGLWKTDLPAMAAKTVLKSMLSRWGILSTKMQAAMKTDQGAVNDIDKPIEETTVEYVDVNDNHTGEKEESQQAERRKAGPDAKAPPKPTAPTADADIPEEPGEPDLF